MANARVSELGQWTDAVEAVLRGAVVPEEVATARRGAVQKRRVDRDAAGAYCAPRFFLNALA
jgi:hypothetical protein